MVVSWGWEPERTNLLNLDGGASRFVLEHEWTGTRDPAAYLSVPSAIRFQAEHGWPRVRAECHKLLRQARREIEELTGLPPISPDSPAWYAQMAAFPLPPCDAAALQRRLAERDEYRVEAPIIEWNGRQFVRVSVQGYNTLEDVETLTAALAHLLPKVSRTAGASWKGPRLRCTGVDAKALIPQSQPEDPAQRRRRATPVPLCAAAGLAPQSSPTGPASVVTQYQRQVDLLSSGGPRPTRPETA